MCQVGPSNDQCAPDYPERGLEGALLIPMPGSSATDNRNAMNDALEPGFCCNAGTGTCIGGTNDGAKCVVGTDCNSGVCTERTPDPGAQGLGSIWFKFVQPAGLTTAGIHTCTSNSPALDSILQVFRAGDHSSPLAACNSLSVIGCNDDAANCGSTQRNSRLCLHNLVPGETYYILVAAKTEYRLGQYRVTLTTSCSGGGDAIANDYCHRATNIVDATPESPNESITPFTLTGATFDCPAASCTQDAQNDVWFEYTATCTGKAHFESCGSDSDSSPDTNLVVYEACEHCPPLSGEPVGCNQDAYMGCGLGSRVTVDVTEGQCYKVRVADNQGFAVSGDLTITCEPIGACCHYQANPSTGNLDEVCENLTKAECATASPAGRASLWQQAERCSLGAQRCPRLECVGTAESCEEAHDSPGCCDMSCCSHVCSFGVIGAFCCNVAWDAACVALVEDTCAIPLVNDTCEPNPAIQCTSGAKEIVAPGSAAVDNRAATTSSDEPGFCCHNGVSHCVGGINDGEPCIEGHECGDGTCPPREPMPGAQGFGTMWFKFVQGSGTSAGISTCNSNSPALDSIVQVFAVGDNSSPETACQSLYPIACNDDTANCSSTQRNSRLCLRNLTPGATYYIMVAAKTPERQGQYRMTISTGCSGSMQSCTNCPVGEFDFVDPPNGVVDARRPFQPNNPLARQGIQTIVATGPIGATADCWSVCEAAAAPIPILIARVDEAPPGTYTVQLNRTITPGAVTMLTYMDSESHKTVGRFIRHPGNVNGNSQTQCIRHSRVDRLFERCQPVAVGTVQRRSGSQRRHRSG
jgi:hypothetical protein